MTFSRKEFIAVSALGASAATVADLTAPAAAKSRTPVHFEILKPGEFDDAAMLRTLTVDAGHKQVFQTSVPLIVAPGLASIYLHMQNAMNAYQFSLGLGKLATLAVLMGPAVVLGLNDAIWKKYKVGKGIGAKAGLADTNVYYAADSNLDLGASPDDPDGIYQDWTAQAVLKRGGQFFLCHNAMTAVAFFTAKATGGDAKAVLADFSANLQPGFLVVPAGVAAVQQAQENGWKLFTIA
jgi:hypothetical protein